MTWNVFDLRENYIGSVQAYNLKDARDRAFKLTKNFNFTVHMLDGYGFGVYTVHYKARKDGAQGEYCEVVKGVYKANSAMEACDMLIKEFMGSYEVSMPCYIKFEGE